MEDHNTVSRKRTRTITSIWVHRIDRFFLVNSGGDIIYLGLTRSSSCPFAYAYRTRSAGVSQTIIPKAPDRSIDLTDSRSAADGDLFRR